MLCHLTVFTMFSSSLLYSRTQTGCCDIVVLLSYNVEVILEKWGRDAVKRKC